MARRVPASIARALSTPTTDRGRRSSATAFVVAATALSACLDHDSAAPSTRGLLHLSLSANVVATSAAAGRSVDVRVFYLRAPNDDAVTLFGQTFDVDVGTKQLPVAVDIAPCLADPDRSPGEGSRGCPIRIAVTLRDPTGAVVDSQAVGPITAAPGTTASVPEFTLREGTTIAAVSGAQQVTIVGRPVLLPVIVKVTDRNGAPVANREITVTAVAGNGKVASQPRVTDAQGSAQITGLEAGATAGVNTFRVSLSGASGTNALTVTVDGVPSSQQGLAASARFTCITRVAAPSLCWGTNMFGGVGDGTGIDRSLPVPVATSAVFTSLTGSTSNVTASKGICGLTGTGQAYCWGTNVDGFLGFTSSDTCPRISATAPIPTCAKAPQPVLGAPVLASIGVGAGSGGDDGSAALFYPMRVCGVTPNGDAYCWGHNASGGLGTGDLQSRSAPTPVTGGLKFVRVAVGDATTCGLAATEEIYCWGASALLGIANASNATIPARIASTERFIDVGVGSFFACGLTRDRALYCWGNDVDASRLPVRISTSVVLATMSVGRSHACGLTASGDAYCWTFTAPGGEIGDGTTDPAPVPTAVAGGLRFREISAGGGQTCAIELAGTLYCWGRNESGQLGIGNTVASLVPVRANITGQAPGVATQIAPNVASALPPVAVGSLARLGPTVRVSDANGAAVAGVSVTFAVTAGGGSVTPTTVVTNAAGIATTTFRAGPSPGPNAVSATAAGLSGSPVVFTTTAAQPGAPTTVAQTVIATRAGAAGTLLAQLPSVTVTDANRLFVPNAIVTFTRRTARGGTITPALPASVRTNVDGVAALTSWVLDTLAGTDTVSATVPGISGEVLFTVVTTAGPATTLGFATSPTTVRAGAVIAPAVRVVITDRWGNTVTAAAGPVTLTLMSGQPGVTLGGTTTVDAVGGIATFSDLTVSTPGSYQLRASGPGLAAVLGGVFAVTP